MVRKGRGGTQMDNSGSTPAGLGEAIRRPLGCMERGGSLQCEEEGSSAAVFQSQGPRSS